MIDPWSLPGPAAFLKDLSEDLRDGRQVVLHGTPPPGLRPALEAVLAANQISLRVIYDDPDLDAGTVLKREASGTGVETPLRAGAWWIQDIEPYRRDQWLACVGLMAERARHDPPARRALLVVPTAEPTRPATGLDVAWHRAEPLGLVDLEVAARYIAAARGPVALKDRVQMDLAVKMASAWLPKAEALRVLHTWMEAPNDVLRHPERLAEYAEAANASLVSPRYELWRSQYVVLLTKIEELRLQVINTADIRWTVPYLWHVEGHPPRRVMTAEQLELTHICAQLRDSGHSRTSPLRRKIEALRELRNALSHLQPIDMNEIESLDVSPPGPE